MLRCVGYLNSSNFAVSDGILQTAQSFFPYFLNGNRVIHVEIHRPYIFPIPKNDRNTTKTRACIMQPIMQTPTARNVLLKSRACLTATTMVTSIQTAATKMISCEMPDYNADDAN